MDRLLLPAGVTGRCQWQRGGRFRVAAELEAGVARPFIVNRPGLVPAAGAESDALTQIFPDMLPTFDGSGRRTSCPEALCTDGSSIAPLLLGKAKDTQRKWIMALGYGAAKLTKDGIRPSKTFFHPR